MMVSARFRKSQNYPDENWIEIKGLGVGITGITIGQSYALRDALNACIEEWENEYKEFPRKDEREKVVEKLKKLCNDEIHSLIVGEQSRDTEQSETLRNAISAGLYKGYTICRNPTERSGGGKV
jgi:hypothetical protein